MVLIAGYTIGCGGPQALHAATDRRCLERKERLLANPLEGRPLRQRREMVSIYGRQRLRETAALQVSTDRRCLERKERLLANPPGGRPLGAVKWC